MTDERAEERDRDLNLLAQAIPFIDRYKPEMVLSENVASIERGKYSHIWTGFQSELRDMGLPRRQRRGSRASVWNSAAAAALHHTRGQGDERIDL